MKTKNTNEYRDDVLTHLRYIKEKVDANFKHLERVNGRLNKAENSIIAIKTIGSTLTIMIGIILTWFGIQK